jgi:hypothetical protein
MKIDRGIADIKIINEIILNIREISENHAEKKVQEDIQNSSGARVITLIPY